VDALVGVLDISSNSVPRSGLFDHGIHRFSRIWSFVAHGNLTYSRAYSLDFSNVAELHSPLSYSVDSGSGSSSNSDSSSYFRGLYSSSYSILDLGWHTEPDSKS
jgi:hypothetical protein